MLEIAERLVHQKKYREAICELQKIVGEEVIKSRTLLAFCFYEIRDQTSGDAETLKTEDPKAYYFACKWHRMRSNSLQAEKFYNLGTKLQVTIGGDGPSLWDWAFESSVFSYYICRTKKRESLKSILSSIRGVSAARIPHDQFENFMRNLSFYTEPLIEFPKTDLQVPVIESYQSSTPCLVSNIGHTSPVAIVRHVNYVIHSSKLDHYTMASDGFGRSQYSIRIDYEWKTLKILDGEFSRNPVSRYKGIEDIRLFPDVKNPGKIKGIGTVYEYVPDLHGTIALLDLDVEALTITPIKLLPRRQHCEKNHCPIIGTNLVLYSWSPSLRIYDLDRPDEFSHVIDDLPVIFKNMRGSTSGVPYPSSGSEVESFWFIAHTKLESPPWIYSCVFIVLNSKSFKPISYSIPFFFEGQGIEFTTGFVFVENDTQILIGYSLLDGCSKTVKVPLDFVKSILI